MAQIKIRFVRELRFEESYLIIDKDIWSMTPADLKAIGEIRFESDPKWVSTDICNTVLDLSDDQQPVLIAIMDPENWGAQPNWPQLLRFVKRRGWFIRKSSEDLHAVELAEAGLIAN